MARKKRQKKIDDATFIKGLADHHWNKAEYARTLGITRMSVYTRAKRLAGEIEQFKGLVDGASVAVAVAKVVRPPVSKRAAATAKKIETVAVDHALEIHQTQYTVFDGMEELYRDMRGTWDLLKKEMQETTAKSGKLKPFQIDYQCKLIGRMESLIINTHKIRQDHIQAKGIEAFIKAVTNILLKEIPDIRERLYVELSQLGTEGQVAILFEAGRPGAGGNANGGGTA